MKTIIVSIATALMLSSSAAMALDVDAMQKILAEVDGRPQADKEADANRKPAQVLDFLGFARGMTVVDLVAAGGYYTEVLSHTVGPWGQVYMQNSPSALTGERGESMAQAIDERLANDRLSNVQRLMREPHDLGLPSNSVDAAFIGLEFHELYREDNPDQAVAAFLTEMRRVLKEDGVLGITDHAGSPVYDYLSMHRALEHHIVRDAQANGFFVAGSSPLLRNPADDRSQSVFEPEIRGVTDRFVLKLINRRNID